MFFHLPLNVGTHFYNGFGEAVTDLRDIFFGVPAFIIAQIPIALRVIYLLFSNIFGRPDFTAFVDFLWDLPSMPIRFSLRFVIFFFNCFRFLLGSLGLPFGRLSVQSFVVVMTVLPLGIHLSALSMYMTARIPFTMCGIFVFLVRVSFNFGLSYYHSHSHGSVHEHKFHSEGSAKAVRDTCIDTPSSPTSKASPARNHDILDSFTARFVGTMRKTHIRRQWRRYWVSLGIDGDVNTSKWLPMAFAIALCLKVSVRYDARVRI